jgi:preprotein translocase subunit YajC
MFVLLMPILVAFAVMLFMSTRQNKKEQGRRMQMIRGLSKNDRVVTIGGILGSVVSVSEDASEVTLKMVDDSRIKFRADAIREVLTETTPAKT